MSSTFDIPEDLAAIVREGDPGCIQGFGNDIVLIATVGSTLLRLFVNGQEMGTIDAVNISTNHVSGDLTTIDLAVTMPLRSLQILPPEDLNVDEAPMLIGARRIHVRTHPRTENED